MQSNLLSGQRDIARPTTAIGPDFDGCSHGPDDQIDCPIHIEFFQCTAVDVRDNVASLEISQGGGSTWQQFRNLQADGIRFDFDADPDHVIFQSDTGARIFFRRKQRRELVEAVGRSIGKFKADRRGIDPDRMGGHLLYFTQNPDCVVGGARADGRPQQLQILLKICDR